LSISGRGNLTALRYFDSICGDIPSISANSALEGDIVSANWFNLSLNIFLSILIIVLFELIIYLVNYLLTN
jgi:uncharacterized membrane protein YcaP (DUF421 family)